VKTCPKCGRVTFAVAETVCLAPLLGGGLCDGKFPPYEPEKASRAELLRRFREREAGPEMAELLRSLGPAFAIASAPFVTTDDGSEPFDVRCLASRGSWAHKKLIEARGKVEAMLAKIDGER